MNKFHQQIIDNITDPNALLIIQMLQNEVAAKDAEIAHQKDLLDAEKREAERAAYADKWKEENFQEWLKERREIEEWQNQQIEEEN